MAASKTAELQVYRYRPEQESGPTFETFQVPYQDNWMILDALNHIKDRLDDSLSYRWACRMGVCGSCGMMVNGEPVLTCATYVEKVLPGPIRIEPLRGFPVIRDLVGDLSDFMEKLARVKPWIIREHEKGPSEGEYLQTPEELADYKRYAMCINCMLCYAACPIYELEPDFIGPAAIALAQRYNLDSRDEGARERMDVISQHEGIWSCTFVGECSAVCPKNVDPAGAIQRYKVDATMDWFKSLLAPRGAR
ncbi:MAG TPA: succinate dehydrogenase/fumarate reductase iron-sulfur subunit [Longimicrobiales bacterium]|nr:succinate dehydrogenase/fumarate reductase iron-sulfur subunit [Longimicrobiales bacterium]